eukprot:CAMPEP_0117883216 /NCGR_PEP_ID=MMETSP0950-20121206/17971_1 /TAXON_ID=44440 /ORGANISM="Chattonella subsalsa, Strain CCMP2191" /LENGTH=238 /DNA_ID=CAMNT_0005738987 /DNA_START=33 /DNA_END=749 /DNA_ORIENTATION=+
MSSTIIISGAVDGNFHAWEASKQCDTPLLKIFSRKDKSSTYPTSVIWSDLQKQFYGGYDDMSIVRWCFQTGRALQKFVLKSLRDSFAAPSPTAKKTSHSSISAFHLQVSSENTVQLFSGCSMGHIFSVSLTGGSEKTKLVKLQGHRKKVTGLTVCLAPSETHLISCSMDKTIRFWDLTTRVCVLIKHQTSPILSVASIQDCFCAASLDGCLYFFTDVELEQNRKDESERRLLDAEQSC